VDLRTSWAIDALVFIFRHIVSIAKPMLDLELGLRPLLDRGKGVGSSPLAIILSARAPESSAIDVGSAQKRPRPASIQRRSM
jgi:hypothetical protein